MLKVCIELIFFKMILSPFPLFKAWIDAHAIHLFMVAKYGNSIRANVVE